MVKACRHPGAEPFAPPSAPSLLPRTGGWTVRSSPPPLANGEVHVWRILVPDADNLPSSWPGLLAAEERERVARKRVPLDARRTLTSRACLRLLLGRYLGVPPTAVAFVARATGKLQLAAPAPTALEFNVSHSGDWVVLAFASGLPVGVDVECHRDLEFGELVHSFFSQEERADWSSLPAAEHPNAFFSAWTRKEAYLKALGVGLAKPLDSFSVAIGRGPTSGLVSCASDPSAPQRWLIVPIDLAPGYTCALAVASGATALHTFTFAPPAPAVGGSGE